MPEDLSIEKAAEMTGASTRSYALADVRQRVAEKEMAHPQRVGLAHAALGEIEDALGKLAALGHRYFLTEHPPAEAEAWPVMVYRGEDSGLEATTVESQEALDEKLADGWRKHPSPEAAEVSEGTESASGKASAPVPEGLAADATKSAPAQPDPSLGVASQPAVSVTRRGGSGQIGTGGQASSNATTSDLPAGVNKSDDSGDAAAGDEKGDC